MQLSTINEVADRLKLSTRKVHQLIHSGHLPKVQIGRSVRIREDDLAALVRRGYSGIPSDQANDHSSEEKY